MHLARAVLRVRSPERLARFYIEHFGMKRRDEGEMVVLGFGGEDAAIALCPADMGKAYEHQRTDRYWKIGITLSNVDSAHAALSASGIAITEPRQFGEIGYMCHLQDPEGFSIELLQHRFKGNVAESAGDPALPFGLNARIGQITLRVADLEAALKVYRDRLGMVLLSIQPLPEYGFTLYFLAFTDERPPHDDLKAVGNREWLWQRPYTTLELQHFSEPIAAFDLPADGMPGFAGLVITEAGDQAGDLLDDGNGLVELSA